jgi:hypothetical protein
MTSPARQKLYEAQHMVEVEGRGWAVVNPHGKPVDELPIIYGFNNGGGGDWWHAELLAADGTHLGGHVCSSEGYMPHDLGVLEGSRPDRHATFLAHYPDGYRMVFVGKDDVRSCAGLVMAFDLNQQKRKPESPASTPAGNTP